MQAEIQHQIKDVQAACGLAIEIRNFNVVIEVILAIGEEMSAALDPIGPQDMGIDINNGLAPLKCIRIEPVPFKVQLNHQVVKNISLFRQYPEIDVRQRPQPDILVYLLQQGDTLQQHHSNFFLI